MSTLVVCCGKTVNREGSWGSWRKTQTPLYGEARVLGLRVKRKKGKRLVACRGSGGRREGVRKLPWWKRLFLEDEQGNEDDGWFSTDGTHDDEEEEEEDEDEERKFEAWRRRAEAIMELKDAQEDARNDRNRSWEDWFDVDSVPTSTSASYVDGWGEKGGGEGEGGDDSGNGFPEERLVRSFQDLVLRQYDDELLFEDRVFKYASTNSAKFLALLILIPWAVDFVVHDFVFMPFLDRYVKTVPLAAEFFDVRRSQKLEMVKELNLDKARYRFELEIGKAPPLSDDEVWLELRHKAIELRDEWRLENRNAFANIWSDTVYGITLFLMIYFNQSRVALLKFTGYKLLNNISDTGKAFLIILVTDIFLGYHSASGWEALLDALLERYGLEVDQAAVTIFICLVPVIIDACVKLWLFKFLPKVSPNVTNIFREMQRH